MTETEEYFIENSETTIPIKIGHFVEKVFLKQVKDYGESGAIKTRDRVKNIFIESEKLIRSSDKNRNILLIGKVQSGKTSNLEMFTAFAFDNGYNCVIIYGGYDKKLLSQTSTRFKKTFDVNEEDVDSVEPEFYSTDDNQEVLSINDDILDKIVELNKPIIFVSMKKPIALEKICRITKLLSNHNMKTFIIDDEGDQASLNTKFKQKTKSSTYNQIIEMKKNLDNPLYLSVTATPQANVLLGEYSELKPNKLFLIEPGNGYTGAEFFHFDEKHIYEIGEDDATILNGAMPKSLADAICYFLVASVLMKAKGFNYTDMIIHTHKQISLQNDIYLRVNNFIEARKSVTEDSDFLIDEICNEVYNLEFFSQEILKKYSVDFIKKGLLSVIKETSCILQNSKGSQTQGNAKYKFHKIYVGGDLLQRGLTFKYLITTYFTRWPKNSGNMDTTIQRARWLGYRSDYLELCKVFTTKSIQKEYSALSESENDLWEQCYSIVNGELTIDDIIIDANSSSLNPTRKNVASYKQIKFNKKRNNQKRGFFDKEINAVNNRVVENLLNNLNFKISQVGRVNSTKPSCFYSYLSKDEALALINNTSSIFDYDPFNKRDLLKAIEKYDSIVLEKMFNLYGSNDDFRERTFDKNTQSVLALQQGPDKADDKTKTYEGDSHVIVDESALTIQIFKILPRFDKHHPLNEFVQYMFSIHVPDRRKGFVKK